MYNIWTNNTFFKHTYIIIYKSTSLFYKRDTASHTWWHQFKNKWISNYLKKKYKILEDWNIIFCITIGSKIRNLIELILLNNERLLWLVHKYVSKIVLSIFKIVFLHCFIHSLYYHKRFFESLLRIRNRH